MEEIDFVATAKQFFVSLREKCGSDKLFGNVLRVSWLQSFELAPVEGFCGFGCKNQRNLTQTSDSSPTNSAAPPKLPDPRVMVSTEEKQFLRKNTVSASNAYRLSKDEPKKLASVYEKVTKSAEEEFIPGPDGDFAVLVAAQPGLMGKIFNWASSLEVQNEGFSYTSSRYPWLSCTPDAVVTIQGILIPVEVSKSSSEFRRNRTKKSKASALESKLSEAATPVQAEPPRPRGRPKKTDEPKEKESPSKAKEKQAARLKALHQKRKSALDQTIEQRKSEAANELEVHAQEPSLVAVSKSKSLQLGKRFDEELSSSGSWRGNPVKSEQQILSWSNFDEFEPEALLDVRIEKFRRLEICEDGTDFPTEKRKQLLVCMAILGSPLGLSIQILERKINYFVHGFRASELSLVAQYNKRAKKMVHLVSTVDNRTSKSVNRLGMSVEAKNRLLMMRYKGLTLSDDCSSES